MPVDAEPIMAPIPDVGEHTEAILEEFGYAVETVAALRKQAAI
jgi:crotonobetainyl-CoA:carnitine CoA-transferase CaiB-like acyl-CoA transferase